MDEVVFGRYRLIGLLGEGGMGKVFKAHDTVMDRNVAIKLLAPELAVRSGYEERFEREARTAGKLVEPHIIPVYEAGKIDDQLFLAMPVIDGVDVQALLRREGPMDPRRAVHVIEQLAVALDAAHTAGLVHRDVKPSNALIANHDFVYLIDFGIVQDAKGVKITQTGMIMGTPAYMAPERFTAGVTDTRGDIYALACVLYECLTGSQPFPGDSVEQQSYAHVNHAPPKPSMLRTDLPGGFNEVIATGMAKDPVARYASAHELAAAARDALSTAPLPVEQTSHELLTLAERPSRPRRRRPILIGAAIIGLLTGGLIGYQQLKPHPPPSPSPIARPIPPFSTTPVRIAPPSSSTAKPVTYSVFGYKAPGDTITVTYTDSGGVRHTTRGVTLPWHLTVTLASLPINGSVQASSLNKSSRLNCTISTSTGQNLRSNSGNSASTSC